MKIAILGFGREGKSTLKFLKKSCSRADIKILDRKLDKDYLKKLNEFDVVYRTPGIPYNLPEIKKAVKASVKFSSATQLFFEQLRRPTQTKRGLAQKNIKIIGITGTKGKGTTATLLYKILKACGKNAYLAGNIGKPALELLPRLSASNPRKSAIAILELSSFQLQDLKKSPDIAVILDIFPDHLDAHKNVKEYFDAKSAISKFQNPNDKVFYFENNKYSKSIAQKSRGKKIAVSAKNSKLFKPDDLKMPGQHNFKNAVMAATISLSFGCPKEKIIKITKNFRGNEHRLELVREIMVRQAHHKNKSLIYFYNDSASTNPQTAAAAIRAFKEPKTRALNTLSARPSTKRIALSALVLIAGGKDKGLNYSPLSQALKNSNTKLVILFGENKHKIQKSISKSDVLVKLAKTLKDAIKTAYRYSKFQIPNSKFIAIIFSPASASFDMFKDYADRGKKFKELVKKLR